jgi:hypothetical protein
VPSSHTQVVVAIYTYGHGYRLIVEDAVVGLFKTKGEAIRAAEIAIDRMR